MFQYSGVKQVPSFTTPINIYTTNSILLLKIWTSITQILDILSQQYPFVFSKDASKKYTGLLRLQVIAVVTILLEHSFWFSGDDMKTQLSYAITSFKSQQYTSFNIMGAGIATAFNNASHKQNPAWLIQWVISNKLKH